MSEAQKFDGGHVKDAVNLPDDTITEADVIKLAVDQLIILYCHSGGRASVVHSACPSGDFPMYTTSKPKLLYKRH